MKMILKRKQQGFTIIEVMIVLAIAALILLVVFLAVPALQRNQRNNARKSDVSRLSASVITFYSNTNKVPGNSSNVTTIIDDFGSPGGYPNLVAAAPLATPDSAGEVGLTTGTQSALGALDVLRIVTGATCNDASIGATAANATATKIALQYTIETGSGAGGPYCQNIQ